MTATIPSTELSRAQLTDAYRVMRTIRAFEDRLHLAVADREVPGAVHLYAGQEAIAAGVCAHLDDADFLSSTHRGHGHAVAKGCDVTAMALEVYGKAGGLCGGKGGSMHIADVGRGMLGANGVVGGGVPAACGAALSAKMRGSGQVAVAFVGDGGANQGQFLESLSLAAVWHLPCIFVVENNGYAQATGPSYHLLGIDVAERAAGFGIPGLVVDGYDYFAVHQAAGAAIRRARAGDGPSLLECTATRFYGHMEGMDPQAYRAPGEVAYLRSTADPLDRFAERVTGAGLLSAVDLASVDERAEVEVAAAFALANAAPYPDRSDLLTDVYAS